MAVLVGEAEIVFRANTAALDAQLAGLSSQSALAGGGLTRQMDKVGTEAGSALSSGIGTGARTATAEVQRETGKMKSAFSDLHNKAASSLAGFGIPPSMLTGTNILAVSIAAVGVAALGAGAKFESAKVAIVNSEQITQAAANAVGAAMLKTSGQVEFSANQQAAAFAMVAGSLRTTEGRALSTAQTMTVMRAAMDLATATGNDLGTSTQTLAGIMQAFQIPVKDAAAAANILYGAARATGQGIDQVANSVERIRGKLGVLAPSFKDVATLMVDLTKNGITGRASMSALNASFTALAGASTAMTKSGIKSKETLALHGIAATDSHGKVVALKTVIEKLAPAYATMTQQEQLATSTAIFGASAARQMTQVIDTGTKAWNTATNAVAKHNAVQKAAHLAGETLSGTWKKLKSSVSNMLVNISTGLLPVMKDVEKVLVVLAPIVGVVLADAFKVLEVTIGTIGKVGVDVFKWFKQMSTLSIVVAGAITTLLIPAFVNLGRQAVLSLGKMLVSAVGWAAGTAGSIYGTVRRWVTGQSAMDAAASSSAGLISAANDSVIASLVEVDAALQTTLIAAQEAGLGIGGSMTEAAAAVTAASTDIRFQLTAIDGSLVGLGASAATGAAATDAAIVTVGATATETAVVVESAAALMGEAFMALLGPIGIAAAAVLLFHNQIVSLGNRLQSWLNIGPTRVVASSVAGSGLKAYLKSIGQWDNYQKMEGLQRIGDYGAVTDLGKRIADAEAKAAKYSGHEARPGAAPAGGVKLTPAEQIQANLNAQLKNMTDQFKAIPTETKAAKSHAGSAAAKAATKAAHDQNTQASEIVAAIHLPLAQGVDQLRRLGVPASRASEVLKDAVEPFNKAVTALEKAGFSAANAVKIADAGRLEVEKEAKAAAAAAKKAATNATKAITNTANSMWTAMDAALYNELILNQGAAGQAARAGQSNVTLGQFAGAVPMPVSTKSTSGAASFASTTSVTPTASTGPASIVISPGAVVVTIGPGNDEKAITRAINEALRQLTSELKSGVAQLGVNHV